MSIKKTIKSIDFFSSLDEKQIDTLSSISTTHTYTKNYVLHYEKKQNLNLLFLVDGLAKAYKIDKNNNEIFLYHIYKNSLLSEISRVDSKILVSFSNIEIVEDASVLSINYQKFYDYFLNKSLLCLEFAHEIVKHSNHLQNLVNREFVFDSVAKVAIMIASDLDMFNKLKRLDISLILHIQPATLSRVLTRLKRNNIINIIHGKIKIIDYNALEAIYKDL